MSGLQLRQYRSGFSAWGFVRLAPSNSAMGVPHASQNLKPGSATLSDGAGKRAGNRGCFSMKLKAHSMVQSKTKRNDNDSAIGVVLRQLML